MSSKKTAAKAPLPSKDQFTKKPAPKKPEAAPSSKGRPTIEDLIAERRKVTMPTFTPDQEKEIRKAINHNAKAARATDRLSSKAVHQLLVRWYGFKGTIHAMERMVCALLNRQSWTKP